MNDSVSSHRVIGYGTLVAVWLLLVILTGLTVVVSRLDIGIGHVWGSLAIAVLKGGLVVAVFMHLRYEGGLLRGLLIMTLVVLAIFIGFTFFDLLYR